MRHRTLTELTGTIAAPAGRITKLRAVEPHRDQTVDWQGLRDGLVGLASASMQTIAADGRHTP